MRTEELQPSNLIGQRFRSILKSGRNSLALKSRCRTESIPLHPRSAYLHQSRSFVRRFTVCTLLPSANQRLLARWCVSWSRASGGKTASAAFPPPQILEHQTNPPAPSYSSHFKGLVADSLATVSQFQSSGCHNYERCAGSVRGARCFR